MKKSILALLLALAMMLPLFASCNGDDDKPSKDSGASTETKPSTDSEEDKATAEIQAYVEGLAAEHKFDGQTFSYIGREDDNFPTEEEETGEALSDAVYNRQRTIEELFGVDWENIITLNGDDTTGKVKQEVMAGGNTYDIVQGSMLTVGQPLLTAGTIRNVDDFQTVDLSKDWWVSSLDDTFRIAGKLYFLTGSFITNSYSDAACLLFNKDVAEDYDITGLYDLVLDGQWTIDKMFEVASVIPANTTGSGTYRYGDMGGIEYLFSTGMKITSFDSEGIPQIPSTVPTELSNLADKLSNVFGDDTLSANLKVTGDKSEDHEEKYGVKEFQDVFLNGNVLFWGAGLGTVAGFREKDVKFGILPMPMKDTSQESYYSYASPWAGAAVYIPKTISDPEKVDVILEAAAALSHTEIRSTFYDTMLKGRSVHDLESRDMLDIIFETKIYDLVDIYSGGDMNQWGEYMTLIDRSIKSDSSNLVSSYTSVARMTSHNISKLMRKIDSNK